MLDRDPIAQRTCYGDDVRLVESKVYTVTLWERPFNYDWVQQFHASQPKEITAAQSFSVTFFVSEWLGIMNKSTWEDAPLSVGIVSLMQ